MATSNKLAELARQYGYTTIHQMLQAAAFDSVVPGICRNKECNYTTDVEPDCERGWCEECQANTVVSALMLAGII